MKWIALIVVLGLTACQPPMNQRTASGQPCHAVGYTWIPTAAVMVAPDGHTVCMGNN